MCEDVAQNFGDGRPWLLHHDNAPSHTSVLTQQFLSKQKTSVIPHPPYSNNLAPCDLLLFPKMKLRRSRPNRRVLDTVTEKEFQEAFQKKKRRLWDLCLHAGGNYFEGDGGR
jgi:histone-lysine N-methyltransferase SETMAR